MFPSSPPRAKAAARTEFVAWEAIPTAPTVTLALLSPSSFQDVGISFTSSLFTINAIVPVYPITQCPSLSFAHSGISSHVVGL